jgi:hypothetical protein
MLTLFNLSNPKNVPTQMIIGRIFGGSGESENFAHRLACHNAISFLGKIMAVIIV